MTTHKGDWSRVQNHDAARETWERVWGKKSIPSTFRIDSYTKPGNVVGKAFVTQEQMDAMNQAGHIEGGKIKAKIEAEFDKLRAIDSNARTSIIVSDPKSTPFLAGKGISW